MIIWLTHLAIYILTVKFYHRENETEQIIDKAKKEIRSRGLDPVDIIEKYID
jgi:hypothetical protein